MSRAAPLRFVAGVVGLWIAGRAAILELPAAPPPRPAPAAGVPLLLAAARDPARTPPRVRLELAPAIATTGPADTATPSRDGLPYDEATLMLLVSYARLPGGEVVDGADTAPPPSTLAATGALPPGARAGRPIDAASSLDGPFLSVAPGTLGALGRRWSGEAYLFARGRGGGDAAGYGTLGGSQVAARVAYRLDSAGRIALFARGYAPLRGRGAEVSAGVEAHPLDGVPLRLAVERRQRADAAGRSAWMASAAAGVGARPLPGGLRLDAYGQAGVVGAHAGDLFADGSLRVGRPLPVAAGTLSVGGGAWGAAQPGVSRLDLGPQAALRLPEGRGAMTLAVDWRLRAAGHAKPGSGPALTLAADF